MLRDFHQIKIYIPIQDGSLQGSDLKNDVEDSGCLQNIIALIKASAPVGSIGNYAGVHEISAGLEGFTPGENSNPGTGMHGKPEHYRTVVLVTYAPIEAENAVSNFSESARKLHPWEHPVIEVSTVRLWCPA